MLAMVSRLATSGGVALDGSTGDDVFFDIASVVVVQYGTSWALPFAVLAMLALIGAIVVGRRRRTVRIRSVAKVAAIVLAAVIIAAIAATLLWQLLTTRSSTARAR